MKYLLDTNIVIHYFKGVEATVSFIRNVGLDSCSVSEVTIAELLYGAYKSVKMEANLALINSFKSSINVIEISPILNEYGKQKATLAKNGRIIDDFDLLIGCTSIVYKLTMVTRNIRHFENLKGIKLSKDML